MRDDDRPFSKQNRSWMTDDCLDALNERYAKCVSKISPEKRDGPRDWAN
jgi:hypothetical protein